mgnify:CR=1 FL=1
MHYAMPYIRYLLSNQSDEGGKVSTSGRLTEWNTLGLLGLLRYWPSNIRAEFYIKIFKFVIIYLKGIMSALDGTKAKISSYFDIQRTCVKSHSILHLSMCFALSNIVYWCYSIIDVVSLASHVTLNQKH